MRRAGGWIRDADAKRRRLDGRPSPRGRRAGGAGSGASFRTLVLSRAALHHMAFSHLNSPCRPGGAWSPWRPPGGRGPKWRGWRWRTRERRERESGSGRRRRAEREQKRGEKGSERSPRDTLSIIPVRRAAGWKPLIGRGKAEAACVPRPARTEQSSRRPLGNSAQPSHRPAFSTATLRALSILSHLGPQAARRLHGGRRGL